jgi:hypothetical protein
MFAKKTQSNGDIDLLKMDIPSPEECCPKYREARDKLQRIGQREEESQKKLSALQAKAAAAANVSAVEALAANPEAAIPRPADYSDELKAAEAECETLAKAWILLKEEVNRLRPVARDERDKLLAPPYREVASEGVRLLAEALGKLYTAHKFLERLSDPLMEKLDHNPSILPRVNCSWYDAAVRAVEDAYTNGLGTGKK